MNFGERGSKTSPLIPTVWGLVALSYSRQRPLSDIWFT